MTAGPSPVHWVSFTDTNDTTWLFDLAFLTSGWSCTFGTTCQGTEPNDNGARGCCAHGAHVVDETERDLIASYASQLTPQQWQNHSVVADDGDLFSEEDGETVTAVIDEACIFLNSPDFAGGHGCALHIGAIDDGERPLDRKPAVCWQVPFRLENYEDGSGTHTIAVRAWRRSDWGEGGEQFGWWCTDDLPVAQTPTEATWRTHLDELQELVGEWPVEQLTAYLESNETSVNLS